MHKEIIKEYEVAVGAFNSAWRTQNSIWPQTFVWKSCGHKELTSSGPKQFSSVIFCLPAQGSACVSVCLFERHLLLLLLRSRQKKNSMLFWWLTLCTSVRPLCNMITRLVLSMAFVSVARQEDANGVTGGLDPGSARGRIGPIEGEFYYQSASNFENYLKELGVSFLLRNLAGLATPVVTISKACPESEVSHQP